MGTDSEIRARKNYRDYLVQIIFTEEKTDDQRDDWLSNKSKAGFFTGSGFESIYPDLVL